MTSTITGAGAMLTLSHSPAEGTQLHGTAKGDGVGEVLRSVGHVARWKWSSNLGAWYILRSRDRRAYGHQLDTTAEALRAAGHVVVVELDDERRSVAEQEADRAARVERRVERLEEKAGRKLAEGDALWQRSHDVIASIPPGQPILVGHHSERRHRRALDRSWALAGKGVAARAEGKEAARRAVEAAAGQALRESGPVTERRIAKLEADRRRAERGMTERQPWTTDEQHAASVAHWTPIAEELDEQLAYWRAYLVELVESGAYRKWSREDFKKGDYVRGRYGWSEVKRVNAKSVTIPHIHEQLAAHGHTWTLPYDEVRGRMSAEEYAAAHGTASEAS